MFGQVHADNGFTVMAYDLPGASTPDTQVGSTRRENGVTITDQNRRPPEHPRNKETTTFKVLADINWLGVLIAFLASMALAAVYSPS